jgi:hypothetical protein
MTVKQTVRAIDALRGIRLPMPAKPGRPHTPKTVYRRRPKHVHRWDEDRYGASPTSHPGATRPGAAWPP